MVSVRKLAPSSLSHTISRSQLLEGIPEREAKLIVAEASELTFLRNSVAVNRGQPANSLYLLTRGRARYFYLSSDGRKILLRWLIPGQVFGVAAVISEPSFYVASTEMVQDSGVLVWNRPTIRRLVKLYPRLLDNLLFLAQDYLFWYVSTHEALITTSARERLTNLLGRLAASIGHEVEGG